MAKCFFSEIDVCKVKNGGCQMHCNSRITKRRTEIICSCEKGKSRLAKDERTCLCTYQLCLERRAITVEIPILK